MAVAHTTIVGSSQMVDVDYDASQMASTLLFGLDLGLPNDKIGEQLTGPDVAPTLADSGASSGVYDARSDTFVTPFAPWDSVNVPGAKGRDIEFPNQSAVFRFDSNDRNDIRPHINSIIDMTAGSPYSDEQVDKMLNSFKHGLPRSAPAWTDTKVNKGKVWEAIFAKVRTTKRVVLGAFSKTYTPGKYYKDAIDNERLIKYDMFGRPSISTRTALIYAQELEKADRYVVMRHRPALQGPVPTPAIAEDMYRRFLPAGEELSVVLENRADAPDSRVLFVHGGFLKNANSMVRHVKAWLPEDNDKEVYISIRYDVGQQPGEGGKDVVIPHAFLDGSVPDESKGKKKRTAPEEGVSSRKMPKKPPSNARKRPASDASVPIGAPLVSSGVFAYSPMQALVDAGVQGLQGNATGVSAQASMFYDGLLGTKIPRIAEAIAIQATGQYDKLLYCTNTVEFPTEVDLEEFGPPSWWTPDPENPQDVYVGAKSLLDDSASGGINTILFNPPENKVVRTALHGLAYVTVFYKASLDQARDQMNAEVGDWIRYNIQYASLKDAFHEHTAYGRPESIKVFALPSDVDVAGIPNHKDLFVLPSLRSHAIDEARRFTHHKPALRYPQSWVKDLMKFGYTADGPQQLTLYADNWKRALDVQMVQGAFDAFLTFAARLYTEYLQPDHYATMQVYMMALVHMSKEGVDVPILGFKENMSHVIALSLIHSISMLGTYKERATKAVDLIVEGIQLCMLLEEEDVLFMTNIEDFLGYARTKRDIGNDARWNAAIDILRADSDYVITDASQFDELKSKLIAHVKTHEFKPKDFNKHVAKATRDNWSDPNWVAHALKMSLDTAKKSVVEFRDCYPDTCPYLYDILLKGDIVMFLSLCLKNGGQTEFDDELFKDIDVKKEAGAGDAGDASSTPAPAAPPSTAPAAAPAQGSQGGADGYNCDLKENTLPEPDAAKKIKMYSALTRANNVERKYSYYILMLFSVSIQDVLLSAYKGDNDDTKFATLVFWYVLNFSKDYEARTKKGGMTTSSVTIGNFLAIAPKDQADKIQEGIRLPKKPGEALSGVYKTVLALIEFNEQCAQARFVYNHLLQNRPQWFRLIDGVLVLDTFVAVNGQRPAAAAATEPEPAAATEPAPAPASDPEEDEEMDSDDEMANAMANAMQTVSEPSNTHELVLLLQGELFPTGPSASRAGAAGSSSDPAADPFPPLKMKKEPNLKKLLSTHNVAYQVAVNAVFRTYMEGRNSTCFTTPTLSQDGRSCELSSKNAEFLVRKGALSSSGLELNMRLLFDWMNDDLRQLKTSLASKDILEEMEGADVQGKHFIVTAQKRSDLNKVKTLVAHKDIEEQFCPSTERNNNKRAGRAQQNAAENKDVTDCDGLRWAWIGKLGTSKERTFPERIEADSYRLPTYLRFESSKRSEPLVACKFTTDVCNTAGDRLYFSGAVLERDELLEIYRLHYKDTSYTPSNNELRMSSDVEERYMHLREYMPVAEFAAYIDTLNRSSNTFMKRLVHERGLEAINYPSIAALLDLFQWDKDASETADASGMPTFGTSHEAPTLKEKCMVANINFLRFHELVTAQEKNEFVPYTFEDYILQLYSVYCRIMAFSESYTAQTSSLHTTPSLRQIVGEIVTQIAKLRQAFNALKIGIATQPSISSDATANLVRELEAKHIHNFTFAWRPGSLLHGVVGQGSYDNVFPPGTPIRKMSDGINKQLALLEKDMETVAKLKTELMYVEECGKMLYERAFSRSYKKTSSTIQDCDPSRLTASEVDQASENARSKNHPYWAHPQLKYVTKKSLSVNWRDRYKQAPLSIGHIMPQGTPSEKNHWADDELSSQCNHDFGMHEAYASYLGELVDYSTTMQPNEKLKERYAMPFSKWADSRSKKEFLCAYTDYSKKYTSNAAERLPTYTEIRARRNMIFSPAVSMLASTFDGIDNEFMPSFETMQNTWFEELMDRSDNWYHHLAARREGGDVHPQATLDHLPDFTVKSLDPFFVQRSVMHDSCVFSNLRRRPMDIFDPDAENEGGKRTSRLDKMQNAMRLALLNSSVVTDILKHLQTNLTNPDNSLLQLDDTVVGDYRYDFPTVY